MEKTIKYFRYLMVWSLYTKREIMYNWWTVALWQQEFPKLKTSKCKHCEQLSIPRLDQYICEINGNVYLMEQRDQPWVFRCIDEIISKQEKAWVFNNQ